MSDFSKRATEQPSKRKLHSPVFALLLFAILFLGPNPTLAVSDARSPRPVRLVWSDPLSIAETSIAAPSALVTAGGRLHLFWLDGPQDGARLLHTIADPLALTSDVPQAIADRVDPRTGWPVAAASGDRILAAWMASNGEAYLLNAAVLDARGHLISASPLGPPAEQPGRVAVMGDAGGWSIAWTQFNEPTRRVWFVRLDRSGRPRAPARAFTDGDGVALAPGPRVLWWHPVGFDTYRLVMAPLPPHSEIRSLTGTISLPVVGPRSPSGPGTICRCWCQSSSAGLPPRAGCTRCAPARVGHQREPS